MNLTPVFSGRIDADGTLVLAAHERTRRTAYLQRLAGADVDVIVRRKKTQRSIAANRWVWGIAYPLCAEAWGYDAHEIEGMHYALWATFVGLAMDKRTGIAVPKVSSSHSSTKFFSEYMEWLVRYAAADRIVIPLPSEIDLESLDRSIDA